MEPLVLSCLDVRAYQIGAFSTMLYGQSMRRCCEIVLITEKMQMSVYTGVGEIDSGDG